MTQLILYTTAGCHLCDYAETELQIAAQAVPFEVVVTEIGDDEALVTRYGIRIPVVRFPDGFELNWPFAAQDIVSQLDQLSAKP